MKTFIAVAKFLWSIILLVIGFIGFLTAMLCAEFGVNYPMMLHPEQDWIKQFSAVPSDRWWMLALVFAFTGLYTAMSLVHKGMESMGMKKREMPKDKKEDSPVKNISLRYFFVAYTAEIKNSPTFIHGNLYFAFDDGFPSNEWLKAQASENMKNQGLIIASVVINNIYEFQSQQDYIAFRTTKNKPEEK